MFSCSCRLSAARAVLPGEPLEVGRRADRLQGRVLRNDLPPEAAALLAQTQLQGLAEQFHGPGLVAKAHHPGVAVSEGEILLDPAGRLGEDACRLVGPARVVRTAADR